MQFAYKINLENLRGFRNDGINVSMNHVVAFESLITLNNIPLAKFHVKCICNL